MATLRERNRLAAMREAQRAALALFQERGFDNVAVDEVAAAAGMAPSTVYRHFGTKEQLVLWDEHDVAIDEALAERLGTQPPLQALRDAFAETLADRYDADLDFQLERIRYIYATEALHAAAVEADFRNRTELTAALEHYLAAPNKPAAPIVAGAALLALDVAMDRWQQGDSDSSLGTHMADAFDLLARIDSLA